VRPSQNPAHRITALRDRIVTVVAPQDAERAAGIIARAFTPLKASEYLVPDPDLRTSLLRAVFTIDVLHAMQYGTVYLLPSGDDGEYGGVSVWMHLAGKDVPPPQDYDRRLHEAAGPFTDRFQELNGLFTEYHPYEPHHHLVLHAAVPTRTGIGTALLRHHQTVLDQEGIAAYLEAASKPGEQLYARGGFRSLGAPFALPNGARFSPMWREPVLEGLS
jgi:hypothetical protein